MKFNRLSACAAIAAALAVATAAQPSGAVTKATKRKTVTSKKATATTKAVTTAAPAPTASPASTAAPTTAAPATTVAVRKTNPDGTIRVGYTIAARTFHPHRPPSCPGEFPGLSLVYDRLTNLTPDLKLEPMLAKSWSFSPDGSSLTFKLQDGVKFSDGAAFNAAAVKANLDAIANDDRATIKNDLGDVTSVTAVDDLTVRLNLKAGGGVSLPYVLSACAGMIVSPNALSDPQLDQKGAGTGPYVVQPGTLKVGAEVSFTRNPTYWGDKSHQGFAKITQIAIRDESTRLNALRSGQIDMTAVSSALVKEANKLASDNKDFTAVNYDSNIFYGMRFNMYSPRLADLRVRQAINYAIDREGIAKALSDGNCSTQYQLAPKGQLGYVASLEGTYKYDPAKAKQLLASANASDLKILGLQTSVPPHDALNEIVQAQLKAVGITIDLPDKFTSAESIATWATRKYDVYLYANQGFADQLQQTTEWYDGRQTIGVTDKVAAAGKGLRDVTKSDADRNTQAQALEKAIADDAFGAFVCRPVATMIGKSNIIGLDKDVYIRFGTYQLFDKAIAA